MKTLADIIDSIGFGPGQLSQLIHGGGIFFCDGAELLLLSAVASSVAKEWDLTKVQQAMTVSIVFVGVMVGNWWGSIADVWGRRCPIMCAYLTVGLLGMFSAAAQSYVMLMCVRFFVGVAIGFGIPPWVTLCNEITPGYRRHVSTPG